MMINFRHLTGEQYVPLGLRRQEWCFSVQDVVAVPTESNAPKQYIKKMRSRDSELSANWGTNCTPVQMKAAVGKLCKVQAANIEGILRGIQSVPASKAELFKNGADAGQQ